MNQIHTQVKVNIYTSYINHTQIYNIKYQTNCAWKSSRSESTAVSAPGLLCIRWNEEKELHINYVIDFKVGMRVRKRCMERVKRQKSAKWHGKKDNEWRWRETLGGRGLRINNDMNVPDYSTASKAPNVAPRQISDECLWREQNMRVNIVWRPGKSSNYGYIYYNNKQILYMIS